MSLNKTSIPTCDFTWSLITGCLRGCPYCYARKLATGRLRNLYLSNPHCITENEDPRADPEDPFTPRLWMDRVQDPRYVPKEYKSKNPYLPLGSAMVFAVDMGELFGPWVPWKWIDEVVQRFELYPQHVFQILTKYPENMLMYQKLRYPGGFPRNLWAGTTITKNSMVPNIKFLKATKAALHYICAEPLQEDLDLPLEGIDWVITGPETNPLKIPRSLWVNRLIENAYTSGTALFIKNLKSYQNIQEFPIQNV